VHVKFYMCAYFAHIISDVLTCLHGQLIFATDAMAFGQMGVPVFFDFYYSHWLAVLFVFFSAPSVPSGLCWPVYEIVLG